MKAESNVGFVYLLVALNVLPHSVELPLWIIAVGLLAIVWKYFSDHKWLPLPSRWLVHVLAVLSGVGVFLEYGTIAGDEASASILVIAVSLKLFEVKKYRDIMIVTILCYFLLMSKLLSSQTIPMTLFMLIDLILITSLLSLHHSPLEQGNAKALVKKSFGLALISMPIVVMLFFLFPRLNLGIPRTTQRNLAEVGFSDRLNPGTVAELVQSDQLVFRARFPNNDQLSASQLYWRGAVLAYSNGLQWERGIAKRLKSSRSVKGPMKAGEAIVSEIHMEPTSEKVMFALDWPGIVEFPNDRFSYRVKEYDHKVFESRTQFIKKEYYTVTSQVVASEVTWEASRDKMFLQFEESQVSQRLKRLIESFVQEKPKTTVDKVQLIYGFYQKNGFRYSLNNPTMRTMDDFLFDAQQGFCEHYAGATASLLRLLGVPSRVVVGFQGGASSFFEDYLNVRTRDAHAWLEYYDTERESWIRLDPTTVVAPMRIASGVDGIFERSNGGSQGLAWLQSLIGRGGVKNYFYLQKIFDQVDASWSNFLLKYDFQYQKEILQNMGLQMPTRWVLLGLAVVFVVLLLYFLFYVLSRLRPKTDPLTELYWKLISKIEKAGLSKVASEGPGDFGERAIREFPEQKHRLESVFARILQYRYGPQGYQDQQLKSLKLEIVRLQLNRRRKANSVPNSHTSSDL